MAEALTFEEALKRLDTLVRRLEGGDLSLEQALAEFEEGVGLVRFCREKLAIAEKRLQLLVEQEDGTAASQPWQESP